jgi:hypothetical protein
MGSAGNVRHLRTDNGVEPKTGRRGAVQDDVEKTDRTIPPVENRDGGNVERGTAESDYRKERRFLVDMCLHITARASIPARTPEAVARFIKDNESYYRSAIENEALQNESKLIIKDFTYMIIDDKEVQK